MTTIFLKVFIIFLMVAVGYVACKRNILPVESNQYLVNLILSITMPCMVIGSMSSKVMTSSIMQQVAEILIGSVIFFLAITLLAYIIVVKIMKYSPTEDQGVMMAIITAINSGFMGFPVTRSIFGDDMFFLMVIENIVLNIYLFSITILQLNFGEKKKQRLSDTVRPLLNPITFALVVGLAIMFCQIKIPNIAQEFFNTIGDATIPLSMFVVGIQLAQNDLRKIIKNKELLIVCLCNLILIPALTLLTVHWLPLENESKLILVFAAAFPAAVTPVALCLKYNKNAGLMAEGVALTTLLSLVTIPISAIVLMQLYV